MSLLVKECKSSPEKLPPERNRPLDGYGVTVQMTHRDAWRSALAHGVHLYDEYSFGHLELWFEELPGRSDLPDIKRRLGSVACTLHAPFVDFSLTSHDDDVAAASEARLWRTISVAEYLGARAIAVHPGPWPVYEDKADVVERFAQRVAPLVRQSGVPLGFENLKPKSSGVQRTLIEDMDDIRKLKSALPAAQFTFDIGHALQSGINLPRAIHELGDSIALFHLHDVSTTGSSHRALGSHALSSETLSELSSQFKDRPVTLELLSDQAYRQSLEALRSISN